MNQPQYCPQCSGSLVFQMHGNRERLACAAASCTFVHWDNPTPVVAAVLALDGEIVLVRNKGWPEGWYGLISGFLERGETPVQRILREIREELSLEGKIEEFIGLYPFEQMNEIIMTYYVTATGQVRLSDELEDHKIVKRSKLRPWPFGTGKAVNDWIKKHVRA